MFLLLPKSWNQHQSTCSSECPTASSLTKSFPRNFPETAPVHAALGFHSSGEWFFNSSVEKSHGCSCAGRTCLNIVSTTPKNEQRNLEKGPKRKRTNTNHQLFGFKMLGSRDVQFDLDFCDQKFPTRHYPLKTNEYPLKINGTGRWNVLSKWSPFSRDIRSIFERHVFVPKSPWQEVNFPGASWDTPLIFAGCHVAHGDEKIRHKYQLRTWTTWMILNSKIRFLRPFLGGWKPTFATTNRRVVSSYRLRWTYWWTAVFDLILTDFRNDKTARATQRTISEAITSWRFLEYQYLEIARVSVKLLVNLVLPDDSWRIRNETDRRLFLDPMLQPLKWCIMGI